MNAPVLDKQSASRPIANTKKVFVKTYGCQMNVYDSQRMADALAKDGFVETGSMEAALRLALDLVQQ